VLLSLLIEPASQDESRRVKDLVLRVQAGNTPADKPLTGVARLNSLNLQLKDAGTVLNGKPTLLAVLETLARLDRKKHDYFPTVTFGGEVEPGDAGALARILSAIDSEKGIRIEPPMPAAYRNPPESP